MSQALKKPRASNKINMCEGKIMPQLIRFAIPLMITGVLQVLFNAADIVVVGKYAADSELSLAAVGATTSLVTLIVNLFIGLSIGTNVLCARFFGAKDDGNLSKTVHTSIFISVVAGVFLTLLGFFGAGLFPMVMSVPENVVPLSTLYIRIYFLGMIPMLVYNFAAAILRSVGDTKRPMYFLTLAGVVNVLLNLLLVIVFRLDVAGVAIATVAAQTISATLTVRCLLRDDGAIKLYIKKIKCSKQHLVQILKIGVPAALQSTMFSIANVIIQTSLNALDIDMYLSGQIIKQGVLVAACSASTSVESLVFTAMDSVYQALVSFTSQNFAVRNYTRIRKAQTRGFILLAIIGAILCSSCYFFPKQLISIYVDTKDTQQIEQSEAEPQDVQQSTQDELDKEAAAQTIQYGAERLQLVGGTCFLIGFANIFVSGMRGMGYSMVPMILSVAFTCASRLLWIATAFQYNRTVFTLYMVYPVSYVLTLAAQAVAFFIVFHVVRKKYPSIPSKL